MVEVMVVVHVGGKDEEWQNSTWLRTVACTSKVGWAKNGVARTKLTWSAVKGVIWRRRKAEFKLEGDRQKRKEE